MNGRDIRRMRSLYLKQLFTEEYIMLTKRIRRMMKEVQVFTPVPLTVFVSCVMFMLVIGLVETV